MNALARRPRGVVASPSPIVGSVRAFVPAAARARGLGRARARARRAARAARRTNADGDDARRARGASPSRDAARARCGRASECRRPHCATHRDERGGGSRARARRAAVQVRRRERTLDRADDRAGSIARDGRNATTRDDAGRARDLRLIARREARRRARATRDARMTDEGARFRARGSSRHALRTVLSWCVDRRIFYDERDRVRVGVRGEPRRFAISARSSGRCARGRRRWSRTRTRIRTSFRPCTGGRSTREIQRCRRTAAMVFDFGREPYAR